MKFFRFLLLCSVTFLASAVLNEAQATPWSLPHPRSPLMRVLLASISSEQRFTGEGRFIVRTASQDIWCQEEAGVEVSVSYADGVYTAECTSGTFTSSEPITVTPRRYRKRLTALSYENRPAWNTTLNDNIFFGSLRVVYSEQSEQLMLVNVLPLEKYVRGIAEAGNDNDADYLQALMTASRTYAWYHRQHQTKHAGEPYILNASAGDQVYRGAGFSDRAPNVVAAQIATKRQVITYNGETIVAPFFSHSDGRTRAWSEVWNGEYPWSVSVEDPCCTGYDSLHGHGVGMSAEGARYFADQGMSWQDILHYYYTDVEITQGY